MRKGGRRKANKRRNRFIAPKGVKANKKRKNPAFGSIDAKSLRAFANQAIGMTLLDALKIDFIGIMEREAERAEREGSKTETIQ